MANLLTIQTRSDLVSDIIDYMSSRYPTADFTPGLVLRDLLTEAPMDYLANTSVIAGLIGQLLDLGTLTQLVQTPSLQITDAQALGVDVTDFQATVSNIIDLYGTNFNLVRKMGAAATGVLTFYTVTTPTSDILIPAGTQCQIPNTQIVFTTQTDVTIPTPSDATATNPLLYDEVNNHYYISVAATATAVGGICNAPANSITALATSIAGLTGVTNQQSFIGGIDAETDAEFVVRLSSAYTGNFQGTAPSILANVLSFNSVKDATIAFKYGDPNKIRDGASTIDVFIQGGNLVGPVTSSVVMTQPFYFALPNAYTNQINYVQGPQDLPAPGTYTYPEFTYAFSYGDDGASTISFNKFGGSGNPNFYARGMGNQGVSSSTTALPYTATMYTQPAYDASGNFTPVGSIAGTFPDFVSGSVLSVLGRVQVFRESNGVQALDTTNWSYQLVGGNQTLIRIADTILDPTLQYFCQILPKMGDAVTVNSAYNSAITDVQTALSSDANMFVGQDIMCYPATAVPIVANILVQTDSNYNSADVAAAVLSSLLATIGAAGLGQEIEQAALIANFMQIPGVVDVGEPFTVFTRDYVNRTGSSNLFFGAMEYPVVDDNADITIRTTQSPIGI